MSLIFIVLNSLIMGAMAYGAFSHGYMRGYVEGSQEARGVPATGEPLLVRFIRRRVV